MDFLFRGILIGILFGIPAGAVGAMTVQRTFHYDVQAGLLTGLGSSIADCFYACVGAFGLTMISDFLLKGQAVIHGIGGCLILAMGLSLLWKEDDYGNLTVEKADSLKIFFSSFVVGITNPAAILTFLFAFSWFGISGKMELPRGCFLVLGVFIGTYLWWLLLSFGTYFFKKRARHICLEKINKVFGIVLSVLGVVIVATIV